MHRGHRPSMDDISTLFDIAESLIAAIYVHPRIVLAWVPPKIATNRSRARNS